MLVLAGDIGGTTTRLQLTEFTDDKTTVIKTICYHNSEYASLIAIIDAFMAEIDLKNPKIASAAFGVAGPIINETVKVTNLPWLITADAIKNRLQSDKVILLNDFAAIGYGLEWVQSSDLYTLQIGKQRMDGIKAYMGAGTGLGVGFMTCQGGDKVYPTEGGHVDFAPTNEVQSDLLNFMRKKHQRVSLERVLSGPGLMEIYRFVCANQADPQLDNAAAIAEHAIKHQDILAMRALNIFIDIYGTAAGNLALTTLPFGGLYIVGGIAPKILSQIKNGSFLKAFRDKGRMANLIQDIPLHVVLDTGVGLKGATMYAKMNS